MFILVYFVTQIGIYLSCVYGQTLLDLMGQDYILIKKRERGSISIGPFLYYKPTIICISLL